MTTAVLSTVPRRGAYASTWAALANGESGDAASPPVEATTRSVQVSGTFGIGGSVTVEGSNDNINWASLSNSFASTPIAMTSAGIQDILQNTLFIRPRVTAGDGTTALKVMIVAV